MCTASDGCAPCSRNQRSLRGALNHICSGMKKVTICMQGLQQLTTPVVDFPQNENCVNIAFRCMRPFTNCGHHQRGSRHAHRSFVRSDNNGRQCVPPKTTSHRENFQYAKVKKVGVIFLGRLCTHALTVCARHDGTSLDPEHNRRLQASSCSPINDRRSRQQPLTSRLQAPSRKCHNQESAVLARCAAKTRAPLTNTLLALARGESQWPSIRTRHTPLKVGRR